MFCVDKKLIEEELNRTEDNGFKFHYRKLSNRFIDWIFRHYYIHEMCENFYDDEPDFDDEEFNMYMDYQNCHELTGLSFWNIVSNLEEIEEKKEDFRYSKEPHTIEELKASHDKIVQMYKDYEETRIRFCNWQEPYFKGNWDMSQKYVDSLGKSVLENIRNFPKTIKDRVYIAEKDDQIRIYFYGRDFWKKDYWFIFKKRKRRL